LISLGGPVVSKRLKLWLQKQKQLKHFRLTKEEDKIDTYHNINGTIIGNPIEIIDKIAGEQVESHSNFTQQWKGANSRTNEKHSQFLKNASYSDITVFNTIVKNLPSDCILHLGNSSPVRYAQLFDLSACHSVYSNRGVSGIDGCLSTSTGFASQSDRINVVVMGDLSFLYDSNGLWNKNLPCNLKIVVINNQGGGIFRMIPGPSEIDAFEEFMETNHPVDIEKLVGAFGVNYIGCNAENELDEKIQQLLQSNKSPSLLEIKTPRLENAEIFKEYVRRIKTEDR
ncbi:MAG: thiamine pyrophosphate-dependent enzyme, partial [Prolixibacteraceae bacterium]|nr:thiamine pyrophosphate-dependent enzyme [Prolixibacteraceae bacterium]